ncbi:MAG: DUF4426 domain-containing protein [Wenzhouxiangellaceae bacterium]|nr:DUF4426 domain-containing protein [Wenzhouxiangellaceae bacterium]
MQRFPIFLALASLAAILSLPGTARAQQAETFGPYEVHYSTLNTNLLSPEIARAYGIRRAGTQAMLNVTVIHSETGEAMHARVDATATNLTGQRRDIELRELEDDDAIYYIGTFRVHDEEILNFQVDVVPEGHEQGPLEIRFREQFFTD